MSKTYKDRDKSFRVRKGIPSDFKRCRNRRRRRITKEAVKNGREPERFKMDDAYNWW